MNRLEWMANRYKTESVGAYDWVPEVMTTIEPGPAYPSSGFPKVGGTRLSARRRAAEGADAFRNSLANVQQKKERSRVGRLHAHFKLIEMRKQVEAARIQEGSHDPEAHLDPKEKAAAIMKDDKADRNALPNIKIDSESKLPHGFGFDDIVKERADLLNDRKLRNNQLMDQLVE